MFDRANDFPQSWLAFDLNVLRRLKFKSVVLPTGGETILAANLKRWNVHVLTNDFLQSSQIESIAEIENDNETLSQENISSVLENAYVPSHRLQNPRLRNWFDEIDACWFDNVRANIGKLESQAAKSVALKIGMCVGDYVLSFTDETREIRQPLSEVFKRICSIEPKLFDNKQKNVCANKSIKDFVAENYTDLIFLRLPSARRFTIKSSLGGGAWREEWIRGNADFWAELEVLQSGKLGARVATKSQYLHFVEDILQTAAHIPQWAIANVENGFVSTPEIIEIINRIRRVETIFTKDFSELAGTKAVIITA